MAVEEKPKEPQQGKVVSPPPPPPLTPAQQAQADLTQNVGLIHKALLTKEDRYIVRALRTTTSIRKSLNHGMLSSAVARFLPHDSEGFKFLQEYLEKDDAMDTDAGEEAPSGTAPPPPTTTSLEVDMYFGLITLVYLVDRKKFSQGERLAQQLLEKGVGANRRSLDQMLAKVYYFYGICSEQSGRFDEIRAFLLSSLRTATLHNDQECQAVLINLLLRNYIHFNLLDQADKLISKTTFPTTVGNNQFARYHYFLGRIKAIQLDYSESHKHLLQAIRKAPQLPAAAGFQQAVHKISIIVQLLLGEIPERSTFRHPVLRKSLAAYLHITQAVRVGDLIGFHKAMEEHAAQFQKDKTYTLILRLRHNVIKTGIRMISLSYSKISLADICAKLHLGGEEDAEYIISKAIRDGVIDASLDHSGRFMKSKEILDLYSTLEPHEAFHQRISFCLNLHNEAVKALRFPPNVHKKEFETPEERMEREQQEKELAKELEDEDDDDLY